MPPSMPNKDKSPRIGYVLSIKSFVTSYIYGWLNLLYALTESPKIHFKPKRIEAAFSNLSLTHQESTESPIHFKWCDTRKSSNNVVQVRMKAAIPIMVRWKMSFSHQFHRQSNGSIRMLVAAHQVVLLPISPRKVWAKIWAANHREATFPHLKV